MKQDLTILLIEDDVSMCQAMNNYISNTEDTKLVGITKDIIKALEYFTSYQPDVIILDLELHDGNGDGLSFLENLALLDIEHQPFILVSTNNSSQIIYNQVRKLGADFIIPKYKEDYSAQNTIEFLRTLRQSIQHSHKNKYTRPSLPVLESPQKDQERINKKIFSEFNHIGISPKMKGRKYLSDAILLLLEESSTSKVCSIIAKNYGKTEASVSRAMQNAINKSWNTCNIDDLDKYYTAHIHSDKCVPTYMEFIHYYADKIRTN